MVSCFEDVFLGLAYKPCLVRVYGFNTAVVKCSDACVSGVGYSYQQLFGLKLYIHLEHNKGTNIIFGYKLLITAYILLTLITLF